MALYHELEGAGHEVVVFLHAGIADSRMWEPQWTSFAGRHRLLRCDLAGFGRTPIESCLSPMRRTWSASWTDWVSLRPAADVDPDVRATVAEMQRQALELQAPYWERLDEDLLVPEIAERLDDVRAPTLVLVGEEDVEDMHRLAERFATEIPRARLVTISDAAHLPNLEQPAVFDELVLGFSSRSPKPQARARRARRPGARPGRRRDGGGAASTALRARPRPPPPVARPWRPEAAGHAGRGRSLGGSGCSGTSGLLRVSLITRRTKGPGSSTQTRLLAPW
jgi:hypothetical protein